MASPGFWSRESQEARKARAMGLLHFLGTEVRLGMALSIQEVTDFYSRETVEMSLDRYKLKSDST
jgi:hypothetical protein